MSSTRSIGSLKFDFASLEAMALAVPATPDHPNKHPFTGVLTKVGRPSDKAPQGSFGKRVLLTHKAAEAALGSLLGMGVDYTPDLDGHDPTQKIGVITAAEIKGNDLAITGFFYAADFPEVVARIRADRTAMGFSFEAQRVAVESAEADPLVITACVFTGAAVLKRSSGAYLETSIAAQAAGRSTAVETIELDGITRRLLEKHGIEAPGLNVRAGAINASAFDADKFAADVERKISDPRLRLQCKIAVNRRLGVSEGVRAGLLGR